MGNFVKKLFFKWWIWPLPLIALQVIQFFLIRKSTVRKITAEDQGKYTEPKEFTIYEGVWDEFYLARFEVWYIDYATHTKRKLTEKTYKVDGWMR